MKRLLLPITGLSFFLFWYFVSPDIFPSRYPLAFSDGTYHDVGAESWTKYLLDPGSTGDAFRHLVLPEHSFLIIKYLVVLIVCMFLPSLFMTSVKSSYTDKFRAGRKLIKSVFVSKWKFKFMSLFRSGVHFTSWQKVPRTAEVSHLLMLGSTGSGKTQAIAKLLKDIFERGDKVVMLDTKGDYTSYACDPEKAFLISPGDARTPTWEVGSDIPSQLDLEVLLDALVEKEGSENPIWPLSARAALKAVILKLLDRKKNFTFQDLDEELLPHNIRQAAKVYDPKLYDTIKDPTNETGQSVLFTLNSMSGGLSSLYGNGKETFSVSNFLQDPSKSRLILRRHPSQEFTFKLSARLLLGVLQVQVLSMPDSKKRRVWVILDELAVLGEFRPLIEFLERGRSKGLCVVAGIQDYGTIEKYYKEESRSLYTNFVSKMFLAMKEPNSAKYYAESIGENTYDRITTTANKNSIFSLTPAVSTQVAPQNVPIVSQSQLLHTPRPSKKGIFAYADIASYPIARIKFPITPLIPKYPDFIPYANGISDPPPPPTAPSGGGASASMKNEQKQEQKESETTQKDKNAVTFTKHQRLPDQTKENLKYFRTALEKKFHPHKSMGVLKDLLQIAEVLVSAHFMAIPDSLEVIHASVETEKDVSTNISQKDKKEHLATPHELKRKVQHVQKKDNNG